MLWRIFRIIGGFFLDIIETAVFALAIFVLVYVFLAQPHQVSGRSMVPTFQDGEFVLTNKMAYRRGEPERGDVVIFHAPANAHCPPGGACDFIKRIIGLPGETVSVRGGKVLINSQELAEEYLPPEFVTRGDTYLQEGSMVTLQANQYFMMGDNRPGSSDSRAFGPVPVESIVGRAWIRYWPVSKLGVIEHVAYAN
ncbi:MAG: signal peptidase I [Candidatus Chisholmbacteria bacterium]|nr:signal peptidase I [Candidatus Chisholmbacteria bacterium]